ncbi:hypothetical protein POM88_041105 [Heracleum sosnowskyi]|uniref:Uncharacterized protein n=1 Tax=Heracleum sosnowskyi TaxID=360622 RepID=A0AAD8HE55_9APIA|nr:hypothetical protein POM88_041105 [Heracleum sosnowskyi]
MTEFYHLQVESSNLQLPRILGMTASLINTKGYWKKIHELKNLMNSKVFTCSSESVITEHLAMSTLKLRSYRHMDIPYSLVEKIASELNTLKEKELGLWLAIKAADTSSSKASEMFIWDKLDKCGERILTDLSSDAFKVFSSYMPSGMLPPSERTKLLEFSKLYLWPIVGCY